MTALPNNNATWAAFRSIQSRRTIIPFATTAFIILLVLTYFYLRPAPSQPVIAGNNISSCINFYYANKAANYDVAKLYDVYGFCYNSQIAQLSFEEDSVRRDNFVFQRSENIALLAMVIGITLSGVALAGLQLFASYKLALRGKGALADGGEANFTPNSVIVKSSVVGVVILAISFAFFMVYVIDVYTLRDTAPGPTRAAPLPSTSAASPQLTLRPGPVPTAGQTEHLSGSAAPGAVAATGAQPVPSLTPAAPQNHP